MYQLSKLYVRFDNNYMKPDFGEIFGSVSYIDNDFQCSFAVVYII